jgi:PAS domain S-box-containing protein
MDDHELLFGERLADLTASNGWLRSLVEQSLAGVYIIQNRRFRFVNQAFADIFGYASPAELIEQIVEIQLIAPEDRNRVLKNISSRERGEVPAMRYEFAGLRRDGSHIDIEVHGYRMEFEGKPAVAGILLDITERKKAERALLAAKAEVERISQARAHFFSSASHDLRQPLQALRLFVDMLSVDLNGGKYQQKIDCAAKALTSAEALLHSLFDIARIESGAFAPALIEIDIPKLLAKLTAEFAPLAEAEGLVFHARVSAVSLRSDPLMLERMLRNLIANAVRYTEQGSILLACRQRKEAVAIEVWDTGPGIAPEHHQAIWEDFYQVGNDARDSKLGLGLGLPIVAKLAEQLGYRLEMRSRLQVGTLFRVIIPT